MNYIKKNKESILGLLAFIVYLLLSYMEGPILNFLGINNYNLIIKCILLLTYDLVTLLCLIYFFLLQFVKDFKDFKLNYKYYLNTYLKYWFLNIGLMLISSLIVSSITHIDNSTNQEYVVSLLNKLPIFMIVSTAIIAPITEELAFRNSFRKIFKNDLLFIILSGFTFGLMHLSVAKTPLELLYIIPYSIPGFIFAYTLSKSKNIFVPISLHLLHNSVMVILQFLTVLIH